MAVRTPKLPGRRRKVKEIARFLEPLPQTRTREAIRKSWIERPQGRVIGAGAVLEPLLQREVYLVGTWPMYSSSNGAGARFDLETEDQALG